VRFVESVSAQLAQSVPGFAVARDRVLSAAAGPPLTVVGTAFAGTVQPGGMSAGTYVELTGLPVREVADRLLRRPLHALLPGLAAVPVVLVDALDESLGYGSEVGIVQVIRSLGDGTPIRWLLTSRPDARVLDQLPRARRVDLIDDCPTEIDDVAAYLTLRLAESRTGGGTGIDADSSGADRPLMTRLAAAAAGNFLYAHYVINDLLADPARLARARRDPGSLWLPSDLAGVYRDFLDREIRRTDPPEARRRWRDLYRPLLAALAVAYEPGLTGRQLASLLDTSVTNVEDGLEDCRQLLDPPRRPDSLEDADGPWRIYHPSFREFLSTGHDRITEPAEVHATLGRVFCRDWAGTWDGADDYALEHTAGHLVAASERPAVAALYDSPRLLAALLSAADFLVARIIRGGQLSLFADLTRALQVLPTDDPGTNAVAEVRTVLIAEAPVLIGDEAHFRRYELFTATFVTQQLHNRAVTLGARSVAAATAARLDQTQGAHARLRWYAGADRHLHAVLAGHWDSVLALAVLPDGRLASAGADRVVRIWDPSATVTSVPLRGHTDFVLALAALPDGRLASAGADRVVRIWDPAGDTPAIELTGHTGTVAALAVLPDGRLASGGNDSVVRVWDPAGDTAAVELTGHTSPVWRLAALPDGRLVTAGGDGLVRIWDANGGAAPLELVGHIGTVLVLAGLRDGRLASAGNDGTVRIWDTNGGTAPVVLAGHTGSIAALAVLADGRLVSAGNDGTVRIWDLTGLVPPIKLTGHTDWVRALAVLHDGSLVSAGDDRTIRIWDPTGQAAPITLTGNEGGIRALAVLPDGRFASAADVRVRVWNPPRYAAEGELTGHTSWVRDMAVLPDGRLVSASDDETVRVWDPNGRKAPVEFTSRPRWSNPLSFGRGLSPAVAVLPDGRLAMAGADRTLRIWDPTGLVAPVELTEHTDSIKALIVMVDGRLAWADSDLTVWAWDPAGIASPARLHGQPGPVRELRLLPDGRFASTADDETLRIWDPSGRVAPIELRGQRFGVRGLAMLPGGGLATGGVGTGVGEDLGIWDPTGQPVRVLPSGQPSTVTELSVLPDGRLVIPASGEVRILDPEGKALPIPLSWREGVLLQLVIMPDGRLATSSSDATICIWDPVRQTVSIVIAGITASYLLPAGMRSLGVGLREGSVGLYDLYP
jgi:WD40 repeat protein